MSHGSGSCTTKGFTEDVYDAAPIKLTRAQVTASFDGDIRGEGVAEYLMVYCQEQAGSFVGLECVTGAIGDRRGSFVLQHIGAFEREKLESKWSVVGSATDGLRGLTGAGSYRWEKRDGHISYYLIDYEFR